MHKTMLAGLSIAILASAALADDDRIKLPADYRSSFTNYLSHDRLMHDDQAIRMFANDIAMRGRDANGKFPHGSVFVAEVYKVKKDADGNVIESSLGRRIRDKNGLDCRHGKATGLGREVR